MSRKRWVWIGSLAVVALGAGAAWSMRDDLAYARIATGYAAKQTCSCVHVSGRALESCVAEFPEEARDQITITQDGALVRAGVLFGAVSAQARYEEGFGCTILD